MQYVEISGLRHISANLDKLALQKKIENLLKLAEYDTTYQTTALKKAASLLGL